ncbi:hypothetical protein, partial [Ralstonia solanacearum]|uniref:hypothetical protein n=1 Tax=Ralstonia solanacearum TaxID=305 RepID=UPI001A90016E
PSSPITTRCGNKPAPRFNATPPLIAMLGDRGFLAATPSSSNQGLPRQRCPLPLRFRASQFVYGTPVG